MAIADLVDSLEQLVLLVWESAWERPFQFLLTFLFPLAGLAVFCVRLTATEVPRPIG
jgi:dolichyl-phosphate beta-glucosyltransferase